MPKPTSTLPLPSSVDKKFEMKLSVEITKGGEAFSSTVQKYVNMDYVQMQTTQSLVVRALVEALVGAGDAVIAELANAAEE
jgi:hypothetical protein